MKTSYRITLLRCPENVFIASLVVTVQSTFKHMESVLFISSHRNLDPYTFSDDVNIRKLGFSYAYSTQLLRCRNR